MKNSKPDFTPLASHFKMSKRFCLSTEKEKGEMLVIPYSLAVGSLMYAMVCTHPYISNAVGIISIFLANLSKAHWEEVNGSLDISEAPQRYA